MRFNIFKRDTQETTTTEELFDLSTGQLLSILAGKAAADKIYSPDFQPEGGWDKWCSWAAKQGKIARIIRSLAKNAMSYDFVGEDDKAIEVVKEMARKTHFNNRLIHAFKDWIVFGRCFIEPVWEGNAKNKDIAKVKNVSPRTITVFRDNEEDVRALKDYLRETEYSGYASELKANSGSNVIGFVQFWGQRDKSVFFKPDELIFIPRYPDDDCPDGISMLRENYTVVMNKLGLEKSQAVMGKRHVDPKLVFTISQEWWPRRKEIIGSIKKGIKAGLDIFLPEGNSVDILETKGNPMSVVKAQQHTEDQFIASMGFADSFTESTSSNRSVGEVQLQFFERDIRPERRIFAEVLEDQLIHPYVKQKLGNVKEYPYFDFEDLTPRDETQWAQIMVNYLPYMTQGQIKQLFEDLGYPVPEEDEEELSKRLEALDLATQKGVPKPVIHKSVDVREEFKQEVDRLKKELEDALN